MNLSKEQKRSIWFLSECGERGYWSKPLEVRHYIGHLNRLAKMGLVIRGECRAMNAMEHAVHFRISEKGLDHVDLSVAPKWAKGNL